MDVTELSLFYNLLVSLSFFPWCTQPKGNRVYSNVVSSPFACPKMPLRREKTIGDCDLHTHHPLALPQSG